MPMAPSASLLLVYAIYGLAFFSLGLSMALEAGRSPSLAEARLLRPLAVFGLLHGLHEWLELFLLERQGLGVPAAETLVWVRLALLSVSFLSLLVYGLQVFHPRRGDLPPQLWVTGGLLAAFLALAARWAGQGEAWVPGVDPLARYLLAVPGASLAAAALALQARSRRQEGRAVLARALVWAAWGFGLYAASQLLVSPTGWFPARVLNTTAFLHVAGFPIQVLRAASALLVTVSLIRATQIVETERQVELLSAQHARLQALERVQQELVQREALRRDLLRHIVAAQEDERSRIARELHDETAQTLTAFGLNLAALKNGVEDRPRMAELVSRLQGLADRMAQDLNRLVRALRPAQLDDLGLVPSLESLADEVQQELGLSVDVQLQGAPCRLNPVIETVLYRIAQEALTNVSRHAQTHHARLAMGFSPEYVELVVEDAGSGFAPADHPARPGWGLAGMQERVETIGGRFTLRSFPGEGTRVAVMIPLDCPELAGAGRARRETEAGHAAHTRDARR